MIFVSVLLKILILHIIIAIQWMLIKILSEVINAYLDMQIINIKGFVQFVLTINRDTFYAIHQQSVPGYLPRFHSCEAEALSIVLPLTALLVSSFLLFLFTIFCDVRTVIRLFFHQSPN